MDIPECLAHLPRRGGLPIPWMTPLDQGVPDFRATHLGRHNESVRFRLCGICGCDIPKPPYWFLVAPLCLEQRLVFGTPLHEPCARAALALCPHLSLWAHERHGDDELLRGGKRPIVPFDDLPAKPKRVGLATVPSYRYTQDGPLKGACYVHLPREAFPVEWFCYVDNKLVAEVA